MKALLSRLPWQFIRFGIVGTGGFLTNEAVLTLMLWLGMNPFSGQLVALPCAALFTWISNRLWTFSSSHRGGGTIAEAVRYIMTVSLGAGVNYAVYALLVASVPAFTRHPQLGVAAGSIAGLLFNFPMSKYFVFRQPGADQTAAPASSPDP